MASSGSPYWTAQRDLEAIPESKRLILAGVRIADSRGPTVVNDPMDMHSAIQYHWSKVFAAKHVDVPAMK
eukprot:2033184-Pyramimonas_sp.AAC.1